MRWINRFYSRWYKVVGCVGIFAGLTLCVYLGGRLTKETSLQEGISKEIIRFHVIANSDKEEDQALKLEVKDGVVSYMQELMKDVDTIEDTRECMKQNMDKINEKAQEIIREKNYDYTTKTGLTECYFPIKTYGDITFPAGDYEALRIEIGEGNGKNWWCVLYPNLCFIDSIHGVVSEDEKQELKNVLTEDEYDSLFAWKSEDVRISWRYLPF